MKGFIPMSKATPVPDKLDDIEITSNMVTFKSVDDKRVEKYIVEEEITVGIPLVRPSKPFLDILHLAGAKVEVFTKKEICEYLTDYIRARELYDVVDPSIVYCENDPLEKVFNVKRFTINDALNLIEKNVSCVPDTCIKRMRQMVCRTMAVTPPTNSTNQIPSSRTSLTLAKCTSPPIITSTTTTDCLQDTRSTDNKKRKHGACSDPTDSYPVQKRHRSVSVTYSDSETASYPWYFSVKMETSEDSERLSVQENTTTVVQDTTDDMWFVEEDTISVQYDTDAFSIEYEVESDTSDLSPSDYSNTTDRDIFVICNDSDVEFWADSSGTGTGTDIESDPEIPDSDKWTCEECKERNTPRQAYCCRCWKMRPGWFASKDKKKSGNRHRRKPLVRSLSAPRGMSSSESSDVTHNTKMSPSKHNSSSSLLSSDTSTTEHIRSASQLVGKQSGNMTGLVKDDSGISLASCSTHPLSQDSISSLSCVRNTLSNFQILEQTSESSEKNNNDEMNRKIPGQCIKSNTTKYISSAIFISDTGSSPKFIEPQEHQKITTSVPKDNDGKVKNKSSASDSDLCVVCLSGPRTFSLVHGGTSHQVCCKKCARKLKRQNKNCPVCRRKITMVVRNYLL